ncbi:hypothetical protein [Desulfovibrio sp. JC022]|uniref:hypothetical protein n=1 Tax=Desulfovibrio sp. JC022 TaxID=2593642 RepID=UPI0013D847B1|nr:hypothetical protein [Desulfovibrio sp. JC022]NDV22648.1 hypothetical protein [Desulfovibrio sp. JC022]
MLKKLFLSSLLLLLLAGCSGHPTSMQDVSSYCRSLSTEEFCDTQDAVCAKYSEIMLAPYKSAKECRMSCESVRMKIGLRADQQDCLQLVRNVEGKCNEFCNSNYE